MWIWKVVALPTGAGKSATSQLTHNATLNAIVGLAALRFFLRATSRACGRLRQPAARGQKKMRRGRGRSPQTSLDQNLTGKGAKYRLSVVCVLSTDCRLDLNQQSA